MKIHNFRLKLSYMFFSPLVWLYLIFKNVKFYVPVFFDGFLKITKVNNSKISIGKGCRFNSKHTSNLIGINHKCILSTFNEGSEIFIGNNVGFSGTTIGCFCSIFIGDNVKIGSNTLITDSDWHGEDPRSGASSPVIIEKNVWIGYNSIVLKGVIIGENSIIGAGSVVTKNIPKNVIAAGNPCKIIRNL